MDTYHTFDYPYTGPVKPLKLIALSGLKQSGKSMASAILSERHQFVRTAFADPLKRMMQQIPGITMRHTHGDLKETPMQVLGGKTTRQAMETLGSDWRDTVCTNLWTNIWRENIRQQGYQRVVVDDLRFPHEVDLVRSLGGLVVFINRQEATDYAAKHGLSDVEAGIPLLDRDFIIDNNGSKEDLTKELDFIVKDVFELPPSDSTTAPQVGRM